VAPAKVEEVQQVVRIANKYGIPLYPISTGRNLTYGGSAPNLRGSVVVDLKRMNRILEVDEKRHFALVEPGVSYFDLYHHIKERGLKVMLDVPDPGWAVRWAIVWIMAWVTGQPHFETTSAPIAGWR